MTEARSKNRWGRVRGSGSSLVGVGVGLLLAVFWFGSAYSADPGREPAASGAKPVSTPIPYTVECAGTGKCRVDKATFKGWRTYHAFCHSCHAQDGVGSTFAPSLVDRTKGMTRERFDEIVANGYTGPMGVMPPWKDNPNVMPLVDHLWSYLRARADGALKPGRPGKL